MTVIVRHAAIAHYFKLAKGIIMVGTIDIDFTQYSALAVEDDATGMAMIGVMMRHLGMQAYLNTSGDGVVELARALKPRPNIIFVDINLSKTSGYHILRKIRADENLKDMLVVAVTAESPETEIPKCMAAGFDAFIGKPISRSRFPRQIARILTGEPVWEAH
jgi:two-component system, cell cycle response regulator DivK